MQVKDKTPDVAELRKVAVSLGHLGDALVEIRDAVREQCRSRVPGDRRCAQSGNLVLPAFNAETIDTYVDELLVLEQILVDLSMSEQAANWIFHIAYELWMIAHRVDTWVEDLPPGFRKMMDDVLPGNLEGFGRNLKNTNGRWRDAAGYPYLEFNEPVDG